MLDKMLKMRNKKGFTLMEMLIVVAIIAILIAIAIPTFNSSLNKSKVAADSANIRAAYAQIQTCKLLDQDPTPDAAAPAAGTWYLQADGTFDDAAATAYKCQGDGAATDCPVYNAEWAKGNLISITYKAAVAAGEGVTAADASWTLEVKAAG